VIVFELSDGGIDAVITRSRTRRGAGPRTWRTRTAMCCRCIRARRCRGAG